MIHRYVCQIRQQVSQIADKQIMDVVGGARRCPDAYRTLRFLKKKSGVIISLQHAEPPKTLLSRIGRSWTGVSQRIPDWNGCDKIY